MKNEYEKEKIRKFMIERGWIENEITYENMDSTSRTLMYVGWNISFEWNKFIKPIKNHFEWLFGYGNKKQWNGKFPANMHSNKQTGHPMTDCAQNEGDIIREVQRHKKEREDAKQKFLIEKHYEKKRD